MFLQTAHTLAALTYNYTTNTYSQTNSSLSAAVLIPLFLVTFAVAIVSIIGMWKVFVKAGKPGWAAIIPFYNYWVLFEIAGKPGWWAFSVLFGFIPLVGWIPYTVLLIIAALEIAKRFGKTPVFAIFGLVIFSFVGYLILGFGDATYNATPAPVAGPPAPTPTETPTATPPATV